MKKYIVSGALSLLPAIAFAQQQVNDLAGIVNFISYVLNLIFPVLVAIAVFVVVWGIFRFILNAGDAEARASGRSFILWGIVGIFLMLSVWGLVNILRSTLTLNNAIINPPNLLNNTGAGGPGGGPGGDL